MDCHVINAWCPYCGTHHDRSTNASTRENEEPGAGDVSICIRCGRIAVFTAERTLRKPTLDELNELERNAFITAARIHWANAVARFPGQAPKGKKRKTKVQ